MFLEHKKHKRTLFRAIKDTLGNQIPDRWERGMFNSMVKNTRIRSVEELGGRKGWETRGENVSHIVVGPSGQKYIGQVDIYVQPETLKKLKGLKSGDRRKIGEAEQALQTVSHEFAHNYFNAINYEAKMTRYLRDNPKVVQRYMQRFLYKGGMNPVNAKSKSAKLVKRDPLFWSSYVAHTAHEAGADLMATKAVMEIAEGRRATPKDLERLTAFRPFTIREFAKIRQGEMIAGKRPRKPSRLEKLAKGIEYSSLRFMNEMGKYDKVTHMSKWKRPPSPGEKMHEKPRRRRAA